MSIRLKRCSLFLVGFLTVGITGCYRVAHVEGRFGEAGGNRYEVFLQAPYDFSSDGSFIVGYADVVPAWYVNRTDLLKTNDLQVSSAGLGRIFFNFDGPLNSSIMPYLYVWQSHWARAEGTAGERYYLEEVAWVVPGIWADIPIIGDISLAAYYDLYSYERPSNYRAMTVLWAETGDMYIGLHAGRRSWSLDSSDAEIEGSVDEVGLRAVYSLIEFDEDETFFITLAVGYEWVENQFSAASATPVSLDEEGTFVSIGLGYGYPPWGLGLH